MDKPRVRLLTRTGDYTKGQVSLYRITKTFKFKEPNPVEFRCQIETAKDYALFKKLCNVFESCKTHEQFKVAKRYAELFEKKYNSPDNFSIAYSMRNIIEVCGKWEAK